MNRLRNETRRRVLLGRLLIALTCLLALLASAGFSYAESQQTFAGKWGSYGTGNGQFSYPWRIAVDIAGNMYVADTNKGATHGCW
jgi:hypothetical protein